MVPRVERFESENREHCAAETAPVERIVVAKQNHARGSREKVEDENEADDPPDGAKTADERLDDGPQAWQRLGQSEDAQESQHTKNNYRKCLKYEGQRAHLLDFQNHWKLFFLKFFSLFCPT